MKLMRDMKGKDYSDEFNSRAWKRPWETRIGKELIVIASVRLALFMSFMFLLSKIGLPLKSCESC
jgi:hypothetical protein